MNVSRTPPLRILALAMAVVTLIVSAPRGIAQAGLVATETLVAREAPDESRARLVGFLQRQDVREQMVQLGVEPGEAVARVEALSDAEVQRIAGVLDTVPAGQSAVGVIVGAILLVFFVLLITDLLGLTDVFPFVKKARR
jgi:hypothetical protein